MSDPIIPGGYIIISRTIVESNIWNKPPLYIKVWLYLLTKAQHKPYKNLKRGQLYTSIPEIIEAVSWRVGFRKEKPTKDQIFQIINWLRKPNETVDEAGMKASTITTTKATQGMLINIDNYCFYQESKNYESNLDGTDENGMRATSGQQESNNTNKNDKNVKNDEEINKKIIPEIKEFRSEYPKEIKILIDHYWNIIRRTRKTNQISYSVIHKTMKQWQKFNLAVVKYALTKHIEAYDDGEHDEKYTLGIMRNTTPEQAADLLIKNVPLPSKKLITTERPRHLEEPELYEGIEDELNQKLEELPY
jgi:hypothetical protein